MSWAGSPYFTKQEMLCKCGKCGLLPLDSFMLKLVTLRERAGFPFVISSGARCAKHNAAVSNTGSEGPHVMQRAVDVKVYGERAFNLVALATTHGFTV